MGLSERKILTRWISVGCMKSGRNELEPAATLGPEWVGGQAQVAVARAQSQKREVT